MDSSNNKDAVRKFATKLAAIKTVDAFRNTVKECINNLKNAKKELVGSMYYTYRIESKVDELRALAEFGKEKNYLTEEGKNLLLKQIEELSTIEKDDLKKEKKKDNNKEKKQDDKQDNKQDEKTKIGNSLNDDKSSKKIEDFDVITTLTNQRDKLIKDYEESEQNLPEFKKSIALNEIETIEQKIDVEKEKESFSYRLELYKKNEKNRSDIVTVLNSLNRVKDIDNTKIRVKEKKQMKKEQDARKKEIIDTIDQLKKNALHYKDKAEIQQIKKIAVELENDINIEGTVELLKATLTQVLTERTQKSREFTQPMQNINQKDENTNQNQNRFGQKEVKLELKSYEKKKILLIAQKQKLESAINEKKAEYEKIKNDSWINMKEKRLEIANNRINALMNQLQQTINKIELIRPSTKADQDYRVRQYDSFSKLVKKFVPDELNLCFHGCPTNVAKEILASGQISSSVDRLGISTSYDVEDQVSVTTKKTIETTVQDYANLTGDFELPAGCIFVIFPKDEEEVKSSQTSMLIGNVNFADNPDRLHSIITTPENLERIYEWSKLLNLDLSKIKDYDGFIKEMMLVNMQSQNMIQQITNEQRYSAQEVGKATVNVPTEQKAQMEQMIQTRQMNKQINEHNK